MSTKSHELWMITMRRTMLTDSKLMMPMLLLLLLLMMMMLLRGIFMSTEDRRC